MSAAQRLNQLFLPPFAPFAPLRRRFTFYALDKVKRPAGSHLPAFTGIRLLLLADDLQTLEQVERLIELIVALGAHFHWFGLFLRALVGALIARLRRGSRLLCLSIVVLVGRVAKMAFQIRL